jgi:8-oxo-dGTP diphosphatase
MVTTPAFFHRCVNKNFPEGTKVKKNPTMLFVVAAAIRNEAGRILLQKRPEGRDMAGLWEFPGGKVDGHETPEVALARELEEELGIVVQPSDLAPSCFASAPLASKHLLLLLYVCDQWQGGFEAREGQEMAWFSIDQMYDLSMPPADLPLLPLLQKLGL